MLALRQSDTPTARTALERAVNISPEYSNALWFLASLDEIDGRMEEALQLVQKVANLNPADEQVAERLAKLKRGEKTVLTTSDVPTPVEEAAPPEAVEGEVSVSDAGAIAPVTEGEVVPTP
jgi:predicted TPR repeat methyltransferase